jgi:hypothetical protein
MIRIHKHKNKNTKLTKLNKSIQRINIHEKKNTKNTVNTSTHITKISTHYKPHKYTHPHITKQVKTTTVQDTHKMK